MPFQKISWKSQSTGSVLNRPIYGLLRKLQHKIWKLIQIVKMLVKENRHVMVERDLFNLVSVDNTKHVFQEPGMKRSI